MEKCINCIHLFSRDICCFCDIDSREIPHPFFMGGSKKCECYEKITKDKSKFKYPTKKDKSE